MYLYLLAYTVNLCRSALHPRKTATPLQKTLNKLFSSESHRCKAVASAYVIFLNHKSDYMYIKQSWRENKSVRNYSQCHSRTSSRLYLNVMVLYFCIFISLLFFQHVVIGPVNKCHANMYLYSLHIFNCIILLFLNLQTLFRLQFK